MKRERSEALQHVERLGSLALSHSFYYPMLLISKRAALCGAASFVCSLLSGYAQISPWTSAEVGQFLDVPYYSATFDHLPDGRFVLGSQNALFIQDVFGAPAKTQIAANGVSFDPSLVAISADGVGLVGVGGFGASSTVHTFSGVLGVNATALASLQNYAGVYRHSATPALRGWLIGGGNAAGGRHNVTFVSLDGLKVGPVTADLCTYSSGLAVDGEGGLYAGLFELSGSPAEADADVVLKFSSSQMDAAIESVVAGSPSPQPRSAAQFVYKFEGASSLAVDSLGRVWAAGFQFSRIQVYDPKSGAMSRVVPDHGPIGGFGPATYQVRTFHQNGSEYVAFLATDLFVSEDAVIYHGYAPIQSIVADHTVQEWGQFQFGAAVENPALEATVWGAAADPDQDGRSNFYEYAAGTSPTESDASEPIAVTGTSGGALALEFLRAPSNQDVDYVVEVSSSLGAVVWTEIARGVRGGAVLPTNASGAIITEQPEGTLIRVGVLDPSVGPRRFARLRYVLNPP